MSFFESLISLYVGTDIVLSTWPISSPPLTPGFKALGQGRHCDIHITDEIPLIAVWLFFLWKVYGGDI